VRPGANCLEEKRLRQKYRTDNLQCKNDFLRFLDLTESSIADARTIWLFRDRLARFNQVSV
jgi:hypothetical protein